MTSRVAIGLGSNLGERRAHLRSGVEAVRSLGTIVGVSSLYETAPVGDVPQDDYLNAVVLLETVFGPRPLLERCLEAERIEGRERRERWGPRTLDLDILLYGDAVIETPGLSIPHPRLHERRFVLEPLAEVWPDALIPEKGSLDELLPLVVAQKAAVVSDPEWV